MDLFNLFLIDMLLAVVTWGMAYVAAYRSLPYSKESLEYKRCAAWAVGFMVGSAIFTLAGIVIGIYM